MEGLSISGGREPQLLGPKDGNWIVRESEHFSEELVAVARGWQRRWKLVDALETPQVNGDASRAEVPSVGATDQEPGYRVRPRNSLVRKLELKEILMCPEACLGPRLYRPLHGRSSERPFPARVGELNWRGGGFGQP